MRELRKDFNMTQVELRELISLSPLTNSLHECGRCVPDDSTKVKIAKLFNISLDYLLGLIREPLPYERSDHAVQCPQDFTAEDIQKVRELYQVPRIPKKSQTIKARTMKIFTVRAFDMLQGRVTAPPRRGTAQRARQAMPQRTGLRP